ncbi:hypothetical protein F5884DRAFT_852470 [Xylogone sp. PMI_703]|nr:hypothetical protein F5884DRAFT_852470 [Xylogone sp. PMI_703]
MRNNRSALWAVGIFSLLQTVGVVLVRVPHLRLQEVKICTEYFLRIDPSIIDKDVVVPEHVCKISEVQTEMAVINGSLALFDNIFGLLATLVYMCYENGIDRRILIAIELISWTVRTAWIYLIFHEIETLNIRLVLLSSVLVLAGGGKTTTRSCVNAILAESVSADSLYVFFNTFFQAIEKALDVDSFTEVVFFSEFGL